MGKRSAHNSKTAYITIVVACAACIGLFQNCAEDINYEAYNGNSADSSSVNSPLPNPPLISSFKINGQTDSNPSVMVGDSFSIVVNVVGSDVTYQWYKNNSPINGANNNSYGHSSAKSSDAANYKVIASNAAGSVEKSLQLSINQAPAPTPTPGPTPTPTPPPAAPLPTITQGLVDVGVGVYAKFTASPATVSLSVNYTGGVRAEWYYRSVFNSSFSLIQSSGKTLQRPLPNGTLGVLSDVLGVYKVRIYNSDGKYVEDLANVSCANSACSNILLGGNTGGGGGGGQDPNVNLN